HKVRGTIKSPTYYRFIEQPEQPAQLAQGGRGEPSAGSGPPEPQHEGRLPLIARTAFRTT
ncbi:MAG TPA: hypothetical protein P5298_14780, partial [Spirochaetia bacterium]|nr:hypothetical protein [Spirochaetales bacterium]HRW25669.1 hypothetical protein [Spirochaetia bacterium]